MKTHRSPTTLLILLAITAAIAGSASAGYAQSADDSQHWSASANGPVTLEDDERLHGPAGVSGAADVGAAQEEPREDFATQAAVHAAVPDGAQDHSESSDSQPATRNEASTTEAQGLGAPAEIAEAAAGFDAETPLPVPGASDDGPLADRVLSMIDPRESEIVRVGGALVVVLGLIMLVRLVLRRGGMAMNAGRPSGVLEILARYPIGRGQQLLLLKLARRIILVHASGGAMQTLSEVNDPDEVAGLLSRIEAGSRGSDARRFREMLAHFDREHEGGLLPPAESSRTFRVSRTRSDPGGLAQENAAGDGEIIDLTRRRSALFSAGILSRRAGS